MKVAANFRAIEEPFGGGNRFVRSLAQGLRERGHAFTDRLAQDADVVLLLDPRRRHPATTFGPGAAMRHVRRKPDAVVVHRINECDERKGTRTVNARLRLANHAADHTVFIASWLRDLKVWRGDGASSVILNGADAAVFNAQGHRPWSGEGPLRIVTHHWGANRMKGFDVYATLDTMLSDAPWRERFAFTYVGNIPPDTRLPNTTIRPPLDGDALATELRTHHIYLTASINEPGGMHHIEGAMCGLPLLYRLSGALPEYCSAFGEAFHGPDDFGAALDRLTADYHQRAAAMTDYPYTAAASIDGYIDLFEELHKNAASITETRRGRWNAAAFALNQPWI